MGYFAVLHDPADGPFEVAQCHLNLWCLPGLFGHHVFLWDVGLRVKAGQDKGMSKIQMALPFGTEKEGIEDLHDLLFEQRITQLIFARPVKVDGSTIDYGLGPTNVVRVPKNETSFEKDLSGANYSFWKLNLSPHLEMGEEAYMRIRFKVRNPGRTWIWKHSGIAKYGAVVDLRIADVRETVTMPDWNAFENRILKIQKLNVFVSAPAPLQLRVTNPPLHYVRLLEGRAWEPYIGRAVDLLRLSKLVIYQWRNCEDDPVDHNAPFRIFIDLSKEFPPIRIGDLLLTAVLLFLSILIGFYLAPHLPTINKKMLDLWSKFQILVGGLTLLGFLALVFRNYRYIRPLLDSVRKIFLKIEDLIYKIPSLFL
ncbi:MAG: hypothetical protein HYY45_12810 [Deltaproteobacteria bacterium]|nr:hypothetical protein [Deltaproteobacteria bacterium]